MTDSTNTGLARMAETKRVLSMSTGTFREPTEIASYFEKAQEVGHFVSPATVAPRPPEGCAVVVSGVLVDQEEIRAILEWKPSREERYPPYALYKETYKIPGGNKVGLGKVVLDKIAGAAGISWGGPREGRTDDGSDPHYVSYRAVGTFRDLGGQIRTIEADKEIDLRDGSALCEEMRGRGKDADKDKELRQARLNILSLAQSKARNRVVRAMGLRTSYEPKDLLKPFLVARLQFTGQTEDPELRRQFATMNAASMLMGTQALYGPAPASALRLAGPPPVGESKVDPDDVGKDDGPPPGTQDVEGSSRPVRPATSDTPIYQGKKLPPKPIKDTSDEVLNKYASYLDGCLQAGKAPKDLTKEQAETVLESCLKEIDYRKAVAASAADGPNF